MTEIPDEGPYILMNDYGMEGWAIQRRFPTAQQAIDWVMSGGAYTNEFMILKQVKFIPDEKE